MDGVTSNELWYALPVLGGQLVRLEPLTVEHAPGYLAAAGTGADAAEVFRWLNPQVGTAPEPRSLGDATQHILRALAARAAGDRFAYAQFDVRTDTFIGTSSYYEVNPASRSLGIGHTWLGKPWWRTGHNTESKLLMLTHAFQTLAAARVVWHTDIYNTRSQDAIARLGATKEGLLRKHRIRFDGSWRDSVQYSMTDDDWPATRARLTARLAAGGVVA
jgi:RimJ/RimL family protein N-acetyltransferase